jgi:hypothetical protein
MHATTQNRPVCTAVFATLREKIACEVSGSAMLADLLEKLNGMQEACARPADFKIHFEVFVTRAADYSGVVQPFLPELVRLLPQDVQQKVLSEHCPIETSAEPDLSWRVA